jgi:hypothetical protein
MRHFWLDWIFVHSTRQEGDLSVGYVLGVFRNYFHDIIKFYLGSSSKFKENSCRFVNVLHGILYMRLVVAIHIILLFEFGT